MKISLSKAIKKLRRLMSEMSQNYTFAEAESFGISELPRFRRLTPSGIAKAESALHGFANSPGARASFYLIIRFPVC